MKYPRITREWANGHYLMFVQLRFIRAKHVDDTITAWDEDDLLVNIDIGEDGKPCGVEVVYYGKDNN